MRLDLGFDAESMDEIDRDIVDKSSGRVPGSE